MQNCGVTMWVDQFKFTLLSYNEVQKRKKQKKESKKQ